MTRKKGQRNEKAAADLYEKAGYETYRPPRARGGPTDILGEFDLLAVRPGEGPMRFVQVKTNGATGKEDFAERTIGYSFPFTVVELLVRYDGKPGPHTPGPRWRLLQPFADPSQRMETVLDEREDDVPDSGEGLVEFLQDDRQVRRHE